MFPKSLTLFSLALVLIAGMIAVSACTGTSTPTATPTPVASATPSATPVASPTATPANVTMASYNESYNNKTVSAKSGDMFAVILEENPSTGFAWNANVTSGLTLVNSTYLSPETGLLGAPGHHQWQIRANNTGNQSFSASYMRSFETAGNQTLYVLNVTVTA